MRLLATLTALALLLTAAPAARAAVRTGTASDPADTPGSGADIEQIRVAYDDAGTLSVTFRLHRPLGTPSTGASASQDMTAWISAIPYGTQCPGIATGRDDMSVSVRYETDFTRPGTGPAWTGTASTGSPFTRYLRTPVQVSADSREIAVSFSDPSLAGHDVRCLDGASSWRTGLFGDPLENYDSLESVYLDGFSPPPPPAPTAPAVGLPGSVDWAAGSVGGSQDDAAPDEADAPGEAPWFSVDHSGLKRMITRRSLRLGVRCRRACSIRTTASATYRRGKSFRRISGVKLKSSEITLVPGRGTVQVRLSNRPPPPPRPPTAEERRESQVEGAVERYLRDLFPYETADYAYAYCSSSGPGRYACDIHAHDDFGQSYEGRASAFIRDSGIEVALGEFHESDY